MPPRQSKKSAFKRTIALCYVRLSWTKPSDDPKSELNKNGEKDMMSDADSPKRQRANIQLICDQNGWTPEWYEDADGHKSGTKEKNRPGWLALKARLNDPDINHWCGC